MRLNNNDFRSKPALRVEDFGDASAAVLTIDSVSVGHVPEDGGGKRQVVRVHTREFPDKVFYMNPAGVTACIERFGDDTNRWDGRDLPVIVKRTTNPVTKATVYALHVAPLADWAGIIDGSGVVDYDDDDASDSDDATASAPAPAPAPRFRGTRKSAAKGGARKGTRSK